MGYLNYLHFDEKEGSCVITHYFKYHYSTLERQVIYKYAHTQLFPNKSWYIVRQVELRKKIQENEKQNNLKLLSLASAAELSGIPIDKVWDHFFNTITPPCKKPNSTWVISEIKL